MFVEPDVVFTEFLCSLITALSLYCAKVKEKRTIAVAIISPCNNFLFRAKAGKDRNPFFSVSADDREADPFFIIWPFASPLSNSVAPPSLNGYESG